MKKLTLTLAILLFGTSALAGGSIFGGGGGGHRTSNPNGVSSIGVYICGSLKCPDVILKKGDCGSIPHTVKKYGVCMCEDGYHVVGEKCVLKEDKCKGKVLTDCQESCDPETGKITPKPDDTPCQKEGADGYCTSGQCYFKCLKTGTCEGDTCKNGGDYPHCWYQCKCPESLEWMEPVFAPAVIM